MKIVRIQKALVAVQVVIALVSVGAMIATGFAAPKSTFLPVVAKEAAPVTPRLVSLVDTDAGFVTAAVIPGSTRVVVGYIDRHQGNRFFIGEHVGDTIKPIPDPLTNALASRLLLGDVLPPSPTFVYPGPKQGNGAIVFVGAEMRIYATSRREGDETGPFNVMVLIAPIPAPQ